MNQTLQFHDGIMLITQHDTAEMCFRVNLALFCGFLQAVSNILDFFF